MDDETYEKRVEEAEQGEKSEEEEETEGVEIPDWQGEQP